MELAKTCLVRLLILNEQIRRMIYQICPAGAGYGGNKNKQRGKSLRKEPEMAYKKPEIVAKSEAKQSFVAGCQEKTVFVTRCNSANAKCMCGPLK